MSFNFFLDHVKIVASTNEEVLLCHAYHRPWYYMGNPTTKQWQKISNMKTRYDTIEFDMMVERSNPLYYKIVRFLKPKFCPHDKELYMYHCIRVKLFDSKTWRWKLLDEVKLPQEESLCRMKKILVNDSLHWLTWKRNIFAFDVKKGELLLASTSSTSF
jgi:hypothetical protein